MLHTESDRRCGTERVWLVRLVQTRHERSDPLASSPAPPLGRGGQGMRLMYHHSSLGLQTLLIRQGYSIGQGRVWGVTLLQSVLHTCTYLCPYIHRELFTLMDGGEVALDWADPWREEEEEDSPVLLILPGITGKYHFLVGLRQ